MAFSAWQGTSRPTEPERKLAARPVRLILPSVFGVDEEVVTDILFMLSSMIGGILALIALWQ